MVKVEAVMKMLDLDFNARSISGKRRNAGNPCFKRAALYRSAVDVPRRALTAREISDAILAGKKPEATRHQAMILQAAILSALRKTESKVATGEGAPRVAVA